MNDGSGVPNKKPSDLPAQLPKDLEKLIHDKPTRDRVISVVAQYARFWGGPLPAPENLKEYDIIIPGLAERIVKMAETQSAHRTGLEARVVNSQLIESRTGQFLGFIIALVCIGSAVWLAQNNHDGVAGILAGTTLVGLVAIFVVGKKEQRADLKNKSQK